MLVDPSNPNSDLKGAVELINEPTTLEPHLYQPKWVFYEDPEVIEYRNRLLELLRPGITSLVRKTNTDLSPVEQAKKVEKIVYDSANLVPMNEKLIDKMMYWFDESWRAASRTPNQDILNYFKRTPIENIAILFYARIGPKIVPYREYFLRKLLQRGEQGERTWKAVVDYVKRWENSRGGGEKRPYPETLADAIQAYAPTIYKEQHPDEVVVESEH